MPNIPPGIRRQLLAAQRACGALEKLARKELLNHKFTLDGRFVGDIGELLAAKYFSIELHKSQQHRHDAICTIDGETYGVQIKCRRKSTVIDIYSEPELLLVIVIDEAWENWSVVYNGPGDFLSSEKGFTKDATGRLWNGKKRGRRIYLDELRDINANLDSSSLRIPAKHQS